MNFQKSFNKSVKVLIALSFIATPKAFSAEEAFESETFSVEEARNFVSAQTAQTTTAKQMSVAQVPDEFDCPLFSNSPYKDILNAIDGLQTSINLIPNCDANDRTSENITQTSGDLRNKILAAKSMQDKGEVKKLGLSAEQILSAASRLQDLVARATSSQNTSCRKPESTKSLVFSMNDTFQSIAPLALDFVAKNPTLSSTLAPYLPVVAGAQAVSKGLSVLEAALKYVPTLDMKTPGNRLAVIKNTCSFMKVYNRIEYLTLDRASKLKKINEDFDSKIKMSDQAKKMMLASLTSQMVASNPEDEAVLQIKDRYEKNQKLMSRASDEFDSNGAAAGSVATYVSSCSVIKTVYSMRVADDILTDMVKLSELLKREDQVAFKKTKMIEYSAVMKRANTLKDERFCTEMGREWMTASKEALVETKSLLDYYDTLSQEASSGDSAVKIKIGREDKKTSNLQENKAKLNIFSDLSVFEPGELDKRMQGMPRHLFNGPDRNTQVMDKDGQPLGMFATYYQVIKKNGPVYDLLMDNELAFTNALKKFSNAVLHFKAFERKVAMNENNNVMPKTAKSQDEFYKRMDQYQKEFLHINTKYLPAGSYDHKQICDNSKLAIKAYVELTDHLISNEYLCKMIDPVLKEPEVSMWLKRYCRNSKGLVTNVDVIAGYKAVARQLFVAHGPKTQIEMIMQKYDNLKCD